MSDDDTIEHQQLLLDTYRRNLRHLLKQAADYGGISAAPLHIVNGINESRNNIYRIKGIIRSSQIEVVDYPEDDPLSLSDISRHSRKNRTLNIGFFITRRLVWQLSGLFVLAILLWGFYLFINGQVLPGVFGCNSVMSLGPSYESASVGYTQIAISTGLNAQGDLVITNENDSKKITISLKPGTCQIVRLPAGKYTYTVSDDSPLRSLPKPISGKFILDNETDRAILAIGRDIISFR